jgi:hypothetical protein
MQLIIALLLLLATPAAAQMPTHPPMNQPQTLATGEVPAAARSAVNANLAATRLSPAAKAVADAHRDRARVSEELRKTKSGK